jgi:hypothetical protein
VAMIDERHRGVVMSASSRAGRTAAKGTPDAFEHG